MTMQDKGHSQH